MRLLFVSNLYPPRHLGGYELLCQEVAARLGERGHNVTVLTSTFRSDGRQAQPGVLRQLILESDVYYYRPFQVLPQYWSVQRHNRRTIDETIAVSRPEAIVVWGMWKLSSAVAARLEQIAGSRMVYYFASEWPLEASAHEEYWDDGAKSAAGRSFKAAVRPLVHSVLRPEWRPFDLQFNRAIVCSKATGSRLLEAGVLKRPPKLIYQGIDPKPYAVAAGGRQTRDLEAGLKIAFVGSLLPHKGVHTAIQALGRLRATGRQVYVTLDVLGAGHPDYEARLHQMVAECGVGDLVNFHSPIPRGELPDFLAQRDVLVLPSIWPEPLALISQEAMAAGLVLVGTLTGATPELLIPGENGLAFAANDADDLARQLMRLVDDPPLRSRLSQAGHATIEARFRMDTMIDEFEVYLGEVAQVSRNVLPQQAALPQGH